ncbi:MAG TPA: hypothetical protein G4N99_10090 [Thermoflexia bacterium]|nr:hypothetical protein [Thermoflexia bacterium]
MNDRHNRGSGGLQLKPLVGLAMLVVVVILVVIASSRLDSEARAVLAGAICALGLIVTTGFLIILVRQYHDDF